MVRGSAEALIHDSNEISGISGKTKLFQKFQIHSKENAVYTSFSRNSRKFMVRQMEQGGGKGLY